ncbi:hypothetical protein M378DRAFT_17308 [Amanita muscaria Koide BX008]|uniref:Uncharacterized protein n=1 Tax=Amanita muscaria (strain Koide BX008) TaxID=946122 RepID=A0A0C2WHP1_AMAMK|nr:hypothetical protein M378DRAFT_17308 [Amanita muscaria Koide BX008]
MTDPPFRPLRWVHEFGNVQKWPAPKYGNIQKWPVNMKMASLNSTPNSHRDYTTENRDDIDTEIA